MKKLLLAGAVTTALAFPASASAQIYTNPVCNKYVPTCEISETVGGAVDTWVGHACHFMWPTLYRLGWTSCP